MPAIILKNRAGHLVERMHEPDCDPDKLIATYRQFKTVNFLLSGWGRIYSRYLRPALASGAQTILDIGCGGGDIPSMIHKWASRDGFDVRIMAIDTDDRALSFMKSRTFPSAISVRTASVEDILSTGERFDIVLSNNVLHHIPEIDLPGFMDKSTKLTRSLVVHSDICRDDLAFVGFLPSYLFFRGSFITEDGLISIRKSYRKQELDGLVAPDWEIRVMALYRNLCIWRS